MSNPVDRATFDIINGLSELVTNTHRLKAVTQAFSNVFTDCTTGADVGAISANPEMFCYLFNVLEEYVYSIEEQAEALETKGSDYLHKKWEKQPTAGPLG